MQKDIVLFWIQGSWKWTQASNILKAFEHYKYLEPGNIFRALNSNTNLISEYVKDTIKKGKMVSDSLVFDLFRLCSHLLEPQEAFLIDWFPRNAQQLEFFLSYQERHQRDFVAVYFDLSRDLAVERIQIRAKEQNREDDLNMETVNKRLDLFEQETLPVIQKLNSLNKLITVNANQSIEEVFAELVEKLGFLSEWK